MTVNTYTTIVCFLLCFVQHSRHTDGVNNETKQRKKTYLSVNIFCVKNPQKKVRKKKIFMYFVLVLFPCDHHHHSKNSKEKLNKIIRSFVLLLYHSI
jgi:hypothetical protein